MTVKDRIEKIKPYFISFNVIAGEDAAYILLHLPSTWTIPDQSALKENFKVEVAARQEGIYFMTEINNGTDCIFDAADYVITFNKNVEERKSLLNEKIKELTEIFATESLETLKRLTFNFGEKSIKSSKITDNVKKEKSTKVDKTQVTKKAVTKVETNKKTVQEISNNTVEEKDKKITEEVKNNDNDLMSLAKGLTGE